MGEELREKEEEENVEGIGYGREKLKWNEGDWEMVKEGERRVKGCRERINKNAEEGE